MTDDGNARIKQRCQAEGRLRTQLPLLRLQALLGSLYTPRLGRQAHPAAGVSPLWQAHDNVGEAGRALGPPAEAQALRTLSTASLYLSLQYPDRTDLLPLGQVPIFSSNIRCLTQMTEREINALLTHRAVTVILATLAIL